MIFYREIPKAERDKMCIRDRYTANQMAKDGKKCEEILNYFFKDTELKEVTQIVPNF